MRPPALVSGFRRVNPLVRLQVSVPPLVSALQLLRLLGLRPALVPLQGPGQQQPRQLVHQLALARHLALAQQPAQVLVARPERALPAVSVRLSQLVLSERQPALALRARLDLLQRLRLARRLARQRLMRSLVQSSLLLQRRLVLARLARLVP